MRFTVLPEGLLESCLEAAKVFLHDHLEHSRLAGTEVKHFERQGRLRLALAASQCVHLPCACGRDGGVRELMLQKASPSHRRLAWWRYAAQMTRMDTLALADAQERLRCVVCAPCCAGPRTRVYDV